MIEPAGRLDLPGALRALRHRADTSQRELAERAGVPSATVGRIESGLTPDPRLRTLERLVRAAGARLAIVDLDGSEPVAPPSDRWRDRALRRYPPHLDPAPVNRWWKGREEDVTSFVRARWRRDLARQERAGREHWFDLFTEIRRLGPGDAPVLARLRAQAAELSFAGVPAPDGGPEPLRYLRDPAVRHWVAEEPNGTLAGHLVAHLQLRYAGAPVMVVTEFGVRPQDQHREIGPMLVAAMLEEAAACGAHEVVALVGDPEQARRLHRVGFDRRPKRPSLLRVPD